MFDGQAAVDGGHIMLLAIVPVGYGIGLTALVFWLI